jgi:sugar/nucleoside kinase (ribokinase family)
VATYPDANHGAMVDETAASIAADGPLTAVTASGLGLHVGLVANQVGGDPAGCRLLDWLDSADVRHTIRAEPATCTPQLTVIADAAGTRTWFASLHRAYDELRTVDLSLLACTRLLYVDCYRVLKDAAARAVAAAGGTGLLLNLGGDPLDEDLVAAAAGQQILALQTSLDEAAASDAEALAATLFDRLRPDAAVVTLGRLGAVARTSTGVHRAAAPHAVISHTHGAGAAFSAGYVHALLTGADAEAALRAGCRTGTAHCASPAAVVPRHLPEAAFATA